MSRHTKSAVFLTSAIASLLSLAVSTSVLAQRGGNRGAPPEQVTAAPEDNNSDDNRPRRRGEQARTDQEQAPQTREPRGPQKPQPVQENNQRDEQRNNPRIEFARQQNEREDLRQRQQNEQQNRINREVAERDAAALRLEEQRSNEARARLNRGNESERPDFRGENRPDNRVGGSQDRDDNNGRDNNGRGNNGRDNNGRDNNGRDNSRDNNGRDNDNRIGNRLPRPDQEREQRQWQDQQQRQANDYRRHLDGQNSVAQRFTQRLREQNRNEQYRSQQRYYDRLNNQRRHFDNNRHDYYRGSHIYSPIIYRYNRGGRYYYANRYQADLMRQAINYGYEEGYYAGRADRMDRWSYSFRDAYAYQDANYGYGGYYVDRGTYNYYFREGFRRGYDDGYYSRYRYGRNYNNGYSLNDSVFRLILNFSDWRH